MKGLRIRPEQSGLKTSLFDLEAEIMDVVWALNGAEFAVAEVHQALERRRTIAYTTVMTTISRLFDKELLSRRREGRRYMYVANLDRDTFLRTMTRDVINSLPPIAQKEAVAMLVERVADADLDELDALEALIRERREQST